MNPFLAFGSASYAGIAAVAFLRPSAIPELFGGTAPTADSRSEIRAVYGGLTLAIAAVGLRAPASIAVLTAGMATGRAASALIEPKPPGTLTKVFIGLEIALAGAYVLGSRRRQSAR